MKLKSLFVFSLLICLFLSWKLLYGASQNGHVDTASLEIKLRNIGHQLLLKAGDTSSRVMPIGRISDNDYQIRFESQFAIEPDTLVKLVNGNLDGSDFPAGYLVHVQECSSEQVVYGFEIKQAKSEELIPCLGRSLPQACYTIRLVFNQEQKTGGSYALFGLSVLACFALGFMVFRRNQKNITNPASESIPLGDLQFFYSQQLIKLGDRNIELTAKEAQLLQILGESPNQIVDRQYLQQEVWEKDGIVVGRSLDVFISKLRKKLEPDPKISIINIHGKGYKLQIQNTI